MSDDAVAVETKAVKAICSAANNLGVDGFFIKTKASTGSSKLPNWMDEFRKFRNQLMHGRMTATKKQADFALVYFETWVGLIDHSISKYRLKLTNGLKITTI